MHASYAFKLQALAVRTALEAGEGLSLLLRGWEEAESFAELVFLNCDLHGAGDGSAVWSTCYSSRGP